MKTILEHRIFQDGNLLLNEFLHDWIIVAILGVAIGLVIAFCVWSKKEDETVVIFRPDRKADRVVFIMDISQTMNNNNKLETCRANLKIAVKALKPNLLQKIRLQKKARYQVIFFCRNASFAGQSEIVDGTTIGDMEFAKWREATSENIKNTVKSIEEVATKDGNRWDLPIIMAMSLQPPPTRIDFLTDGEKTDATLLATGIIDLVKRVDARTKINTIALMVPRSTPPLYQIAKETGGAHKLFLSDRMFQIDFTEKPAARFEEEAKLRSYLDERGIQLTS